VLESDEEEADVTQKLEELQISEEEGEAEVPVIVETYEVDEDHETTGNMLETEPAGQSEASPDSVETATSTTSSWDRMSSESFLEGKQEVPEHHEPKELKEAKETKGLEEEQHLNPAVDEDDDVKTPFAKTQESFHDGPSVFVEDADDDPEPDAS
jgi:hypothetical protein